MSRKKWIIPKNDRQKAIAMSEKYDMDLLTSSLLLSRGIESEDEVLSFCSQETVLCDPFDLKDMDKAVIAIGEALDAGEKITVYGDYDADGVTSTAIMFTFLEMQGADVDFYIPDRNTEGYGMNKKAIEKIAKSGTKLIITVDNGISAVEESELIYSLGMKLVITDHHRVPEILPRAEAIVDPHRPDNPLKFCEWSGAGVAFKTICAFSDPEEAEALLEEFADIVAIGTIADVVTLTGENRVLVRRGVEKINNTQHVGIEALKEAAGIGEKTVGAVNIAFSLVPRINAIGRMKHASQAVKLLISDDINEALEIAQELTECNQSRQKTENEIMLEAMQQISEDPSRIYDRVLVFSGKNWHSGVIGIVASRFVDIYGKPCIVITSDGCEAKGSGRSIEGFSLYDAINSASHLLTHFGGHVLAAGFGILDKDIELFRKIVNDYAKTVEMPYPSVNMDFRIKPEAVCADVLDVFSLLEPFGAGNPQPLFGLYNMKIENIVPVGNGKHLRLNLSSWGANITAMKFSSSLETFPYRKGDEINLAVRLERNEYMGETRVSIHIKEIKDSFTSDDKCLEGMRLYEKIKRKEALSRAEKEKALPSREDTAKVYKYIKQNKKIFDDMCILCLRLGDDGENLCKYTVSVDALTELGLLRNENGMIFLSDNQSKVNLDNSSVIRFLQSI